MVWIWELYGRATAYDGYVVAKCSWKVCNSYSEDDPIALFKAGGFEILYV